MWDEIGYFFYILKDVEGDVINGMFYELEFFRVVVIDDMIYCIEKVFKCRKNDVFVKWWGWFNKFNSWIFKSDL